LNRLKLVSIGRLDDNIILKFFKEKLLSKACQNQGFIIDGFPKTIDQAKTLFERKIF
jgi:adenylate kinase